jgi:hypothetical protein
VHTFDGFAMGIVEAEPDSFYTENTIGCVSIESATESATRSVVAGDPFDGQTRRTVKRRMGARVRRLPPRRLRDHQRQPHGRRV